MANIRGLANFQNATPNNQASNTSLPFLRISFKIYPFPESTYGDPNEENFCSMLKNSLCPKIKFISLTTLLIFVITLLFILMLSIYGVNTHEGNVSFLLVTETALKNFGGNDPYNVKHSGEIYLWFSSLFLTIDFLSWVQCVLFLLIILSPMETSIGSALSLFIYITGGACGSLFGCSTQCCLQGVVYGETSSGLYAIFGGYIALLILNWKKLEGLGPIRMYMVCIIVMIILFLIMFSLGQSVGYVDSLGTLGGLLGGIFIGLSVIPVVNGEGYEKNCKLLGLGLLGLFVFLNVILLYSLSY